MAASARAFMCECGDRRCRAEARLTGADYADLSSRGLKLVVPAAHDLPNGVVVASGPGWAAVSRRRRSLSVRHVQGHDPRPGLEIRLCPTCEAETIASDRGSCLWCGTELVEAA